VKFRAVFYKGGKYKGGKFFEDYEGDRSSLALIDFANSHWEAAWQRHKAVRNCVFYKRGKFGEEYESDCSSLALINFAKSHLKQLWLREEMGLQAPAVVWSSGSTTLRAALRALDLTYGYGP
jgi:hypothetical protein